MEHLKVITVKGFNVVSKLFKEIGSLLNTTAFNLNSNGLIEQLYRTIGDTTSHFLGKKGKHWDTYICYVIMAYGSVKIKRQFLVSISCYVVENLDYLLMMT